MVTLAAVAGATTRIRVQTEVLLAPPRDTALLAKQSAALDRISGGRFTLGPGIGGRDDDFLAAGRDPRRRGRRLDEQMAIMRRIWAGRGRRADRACPGPAGWTRGTLRCVPATRPGPGRAGATASSAPLHPTTRKAFSWRWGRRGRKQAGTAGHGWWRR
ncbi:MAG TPA: LLM class flavin-dependent oxidoreductase [Amycolatopsis sp.]|uniref:LLM class flavin-dependent oxidoreductase n=1 Tax=Amycolatopsis sp. TaxID=37632 RepID=UPI002B4654C5|nr:LLM class flavin-dependent oxidoreductase [Amycolatopsis sp.]HKS47927.1 LLM class flavin-dependent oxidoreductase [Amycolatopsis sp.]